MKPPLQLEMMPLIRSRLDARGYLGEKEIAAVAARLRLPASRVFGFAGQFPEFPLRPYRVRLRVCVGPACAGAGAWSIYDDLTRRAASGVEVLAEPGILHPHRSPAVCIEVAGVGKRVAEGLSPSEAAWLAAKAAGDEPFSGIPLPPESIAAVEALPGQGLAPWSAAAAGGELPAAWGPDAMRWAREHPGEVVTALVAEGAWGDKGTGGPPSARTLVCDTVGGEPENSADFASSSIHPRAVVAGAALAAEACGASRLLFYVPWNEPEVGEALEGAADEVLAGMRIRHTVLRGPVHVPCARGIGVAAVADGMMIWRAASLYGWRGTLGGDPSLAVMGAGLAWKLPWLVGEEGARDEVLPRGRLVCLTAPGAMPRFLEVPSGTGLEDVIAGAGAAGDDIKAVYAGGTVARAAPREGAEVPDTAGGIVLFGDLTCVPRLALGLARRAEAACCGGCVPGRTAPAVAARLIHRVLVGEGGNETLEALDDLLSVAGGLALCPRLEETLRPIRACLRGFADEFEAHALEGACKSGSCPSTLEASTHRG